GPPGCRPPPWPRASCGGWRARRTRPRRRTRWRAAAPRRRAAAAPSALALTVGWGGVREATDLHGGDAQAVAAADGELPPLVVDDLPHLGDVPEGGEHEAGQRVVVAGRHVEAAH